VTVRAAFLAAPPAQRALAFMPLLVAGIVYLAVHGVRPLAAVVVWAADQMAMGTFGPHVYDDPGVIAAVRDILSPSPPTMPLVALPLLPLAVDGRAAMWTAANVAALLAAAWLVLRRLPHLRTRPLLVSAGLVAFILSAPFAVNVGRGQLYLLMLLFLALVFAFPNGRGGLGLALTFALKVAGWPVWLVLAVRREWPTLAWAVGLIAVGFVVTLPLVSVDTWLHYWTVVVPGWAARPEAGVTAFQTVAGSFQHLFRRDPTWNPEPLADAPLVAAALTAMVAVLIIAGTLLAARRGSREESVSAAVLAIPLLSPVAEQYHYLVALIPLAVGLDAWSAARDARYAAVLLAAAWLLLWPLPFLNPALAGGPISVLAYPRLAGALLLWGLIVGRAIRRPSASSLERDLQVA
jgi:hypothetical protein